MTTATQPHPDYPRPAGTEAYEPEWRHSPGGETHYRRFVSKKFPVFDGLTVVTGGLQMLQDDQPDGGECIVREIRISSSWSGGMLESQARRLAEVVIDAADYVADLEASDPSRNRPVRDGRRVDSRGHCHYRKLY